MASMFPTVSFLPPITLPTIPSPLPPARVDPYIPALPLLLSLLTPLIPPVNKKKKQVKRDHYKYTFIIFKPIWERLTTPTVPIIDPPTVPPDMAPPFVAGRSERSAS
jgi:hypothetical protein